MQEFIQAAVSKLGIGEQDAKSATGGLLGLIKGQVAESDFSELLGKVPGAEALLSEAKAPAEKSTSGGGGLLGSAMSAASSMLGDKGSAVAGLGSLLGDSGLSADKAGGFVSMFMDFVKDKAGDGLVQKLLGQVPALKGFLG